MKENKSRERGSERDAAAEEGVREGQDEDGRGQEAQPHRLESQLHAGLRPHGVVVFRRDSDGHSPQRIVSVVLPWPSPAVATRHLVGDFVSALVSLSLVHCEREQRREEQAARGRNSRRVQSGSDPIPGDLPHGQAIDRVFASTSDVADSGFQVRQAGHG